MRALRPLLVSGGLLVLFACAGDDEPTGDQSLDAAPDASSAEGCAAAVTEMCGTACRCGGGSGCVFTNSPGSTFAWDTEEECANYYLVFACPHAEFEYARCRADAVSAACVQVGMTSALELPASCGDQPSAP